MRGMSILWSHSELWWNKLPDNVSIVLALQWLTLFLLIRLAQTFLTPPMIISSCCWAIFATILTDTLTIYWLSSNYYNIFPNYFSHKFWLSAFGMYPENFNYDEDDYATTELDFRHSLDRCILKNKKRKILLHSLLHGKCQFCSASFSSVGCTNCCFPVCNLVLSFCAVWLCWRRVTWLLCGLGPIPIYRWI